MVKLTAIGHLGKDAVVNNVNGKNVINFSVASTEKYKDGKGQQQEKTTWLEAGYWTDSTTLSQYLTKGTQVYIEGTPDIRQFESKSGETKAALSVRISNLKLLGGGQKQAEKPAEKPNKQAKSSEPIPSEYDGDLPF